MVKISRGSPIQMDPDFYPLGYYYPNQEAPVDLPTLPHGYFFHVGHRHAQAQYSYNQRTYGVQIRYRKRFFVTIVREHACEPHPVSIKHAADALAARLAADMLKESMENSLSGSYAARPLPEVARWQAALENQINQDFGRSPKQIDR